MTSILSVEELEPCPRAAPATLLSAVDEAFGVPALVLVNNAGIVRDKLVLQLDDESWDAVLETNQSAAFRLTRAALRSMTRQRFGRIVNVASVAGQLASPGQAAYAASKAGLIAHRRWRYGGMTAVEPVAELTGRVFHDQGPVRVPTIGLDLATVGRLRFGSLEIAHEILGHST